MKIDWNEVNLDDLSGDLQEIARDCGMEVVRYLVEVWGGTMIYVPTLSKIRRQRRDKAIIREHNGDNEGILAARLGISRRYVQKVVREHRNGEAF